MWWGLLLIWAIGILAWMLRPLFTPRQAWTSSMGDDPRKLLEREKAGVLRLLKDLDVEKDAGSLSDEEYQQLRDVYRIEAAIIQRRVKEQDE